MASAVQLREDAINVFTDGSSLSEPRAGGVGLRIVTFDAAGNEVHEDDFLPGYRGATNNQMELLACIKGIQAAVAHPKRLELNRVCVFTDSQYVSNNVNNAKFVWPANRWFTQAGTPVLNADLWKDLVKEIKKAPCRVDIRWVKGHSRKNPHNKAVDKLAKQSAAMAVNPPLTVVSVRRKKTKESVSIGSVRMEGQRMAIRIITAEYLRTQRLHKYKYEVVSQDSKYFGLVDLIYSTINLRGDHRYEVLVNNEARNPRIIELIGELER